MVNVHAETEPIELAGGWSGHVLAESWMAGTGDVAATQRPTTSQWKRALTQVATDPASLPGYTLLKYSKDGEVFNARMWLGISAITWGYADFILFYLDQNDIILLLQISKPRGMSHIRHFGTL